MVLLELMSKFHRDSQYLGASRYDVYDGIEETALERLETNI